MNFKRAIILSATILTAACAKHANEIPAQYISPLQYQSYTCKQIEAEMSIVSRRVSDLSAQVNKTASDDTTQMTVGLILFFPTLFFIDGDTPQAQEFARLSGEFDAMEKAAIQKDCGITVQRPVIYKPQEEKVPDKNSKVMR